MDGVLNKPLQEILDEPSENREEFKELLIDSNINPFQSWNAQRDRLAADPRYLSLNTDTARQAVFNGLKNENLNQSSMDGANDSTKFVEFVHKQYTPGMLYAMFKRKHRNDPLLSQLQISEKDRQNLFQEYKLIQGIENAEEKHKYIQAHPLFTFLDLTP